MAIQRNKFTRWPPRISLATLPTPFHPLKRFSKQLNGPMLWIKRDDLSGSLLSGNKVRKLEFTVAHAVSQGHDVLITCGGLQSNHCRATAFVGAQLGLPVHLVLRGNAPSELDGNLLLDKLAGATVHYVSSRDYQSNSIEILNKVAESCRQEGFNPYIIPTGASDGVGVWGYFSACEELSKDFAVNDLQPDLIVTATGSGGTQAGLSLGSYFFGLSCPVLGMAVCDSTGYFKTKVEEDLTEYLEGYGHLFRSSIDLNEIPIQTNDAYIGKGYGIASDDVLDTIISLSQTEGILLDPVYTGKAFHGLVSEIKAGNFDHMDNIVFIHTGGQYGLFPYKKSIEERLSGCSN